MSEELGNFLVRIGKITADQAKLALSVARQNSFSFETALFLMGAIESKEEIAIVLGKHLKTGSIRLSEIELKPEIVKLIPLDIARKFKVIAVSKISKTLLVAISDPNNIYVLDAIKFITGLRVQPIISSEDAIDEAIDTYYTDAEVLSDSANKLDESGNSDKTEIEESIFDVFLCYNSKDRVQVVEIAKQLREAGVHPWLDIWELPPGRPWQDELEAQIAHIESAAAFLGSTGIGPWQSQEIRAYLWQFVKRGRRIIPVLLPECRIAPEMPVFLQGMTWVDFRVTEPNPLKMLVWGITGKKVQ